MTLAHWKTGETRPINPQQARAGAKTRPANPMPGTRVPPRGVGGGMLWTRAGDESRGSRREGGYSEASFRTAGSFPFMSYLRICTSPSSWVTIAGTRSRTIASSNC